MGTLPKIKTDDDDDDDDDEKERIPFKNIERDKASLTNAETT